MSSSSSPACQTKSETPAQQPEAQLEHYHSDFDDPSGDITLVSSNGVRFRVSSVLLGHASGFFCGMFELPRSANEDNVIPMQESATTIARILRLACRWDCPTDLSFSELQVLIKALEKYDMAGPLRFLGQVVPTMLQFNPMEMFAIGTSLELQNVVNATLPHLATINIFDPTYRHAWETLDSSAQNVWRVAKVHHDRYRIVTDFFYQTKERNFPVYCPSSNCRDSYIQFKDPGLLAWWSRVFLRLSHSILAQPSGDQILSEAFMAWPEVRDDPQLIQCRVCSRTCIHKTVLLEAIRKMVRSLPSVSS